MNINVQNTQALETLIPVSTVADVNSMATPDAFAPETPSESGLFTWRELGVKMGRAALYEGRLLGELCDHLKTCDFAAWNKAREEFIAGAASVGHKAPEDVFDRAVKAGRALGLIGEKPKSPVIESAERDARRKAVADQLAKISEGKTVAQLASETETRAKEFGTVSAGVVVAAQALESAKTDKAKAKAAAELAAAQAKAKAAQDALRQVQQARDKMAHEASVAAVKAAQARMAELRKTLRDLIPTATEAELVAAIKCIKVKAVAPATV